MFHPEREFQFGVAPLAGIDTVVTFGNQPFPEFRAGFAAKFPVAFLQ
jgi:hypothetical protein